MEKPYINVGIVTGKEISFTLNGKYLTQEGEVITGQLKASATGNGEISLGTKNIDTIEVTPEDNNCTFTLHNVTNGSSYHRKRQEE